MKFQYFQILLKSLLHRPGIDIWLFRVIDINSDNTKNQKSSKIKKESVLRYNIRKFIEKIFIPC